MKRTAFFISDGTGITAETLGHSLLTQFEHVHFEKVTVPYVDTIAKALTVIDRINQTAIQDGARPIIFATLVDQEIRELISTSQALLLDFFNTFLNPLEVELNTKSSHNVGRMHGLVDYDAYMMRINAVNYTLSHDDGIGTQNYRAADIILIGVSRCGKTPTCLYMALQFGVYAANYPFAEEDMENLQLPSFLEDHRSKLFGLTIDPKRLSLIRNERRANSRYASFEQCQLEVRKVEELFRNEKIAYLSSTTRSIEEIAATILATREFKRRLG